MDDNNITTENEELNAPAAEAAADEEASVTEETEAGKEAETEEEEKEEPVKKKSRKKLIIILSVIAAVLIAAAVCVFVFKGLIHYQLALNYVRNNDYETAEKVIEAADGDGADVLAAYIKLRVDFDTDYRGMLTDFDEEKINDWCSRADEVKMGYTVLPEDIQSEINDFQGRLAVIRDSIAVYSNLRYDIRDMMEVFEEINELVATDASGNKTSFTVNEVLSKVQRWETICGNLNTFCTNVPNGDSIYLLSYLISETYSECSEIKNQMQAIVDEGHGADEQITSAGEGTEQFASVTNSEGVKLNFNDPDTYEQYMYQDICTALMKYMAVCYYGK